MNIDEAPRDIRRWKFSQERNERASGKWSPWQISHVEGLGNNSGGWTDEVHTVWSNGWLIALVRTVDQSSLGFAVDHAAIRTAKNAELSWAELQRLKNEIFGTDRMAIQVYPRAVDLIDEAAMYHLWVFPKGYRFDFGLAKGQI